MNKRTNAPKEPTPIIIDLRFNGRTYAATMDPKGSPTENIEVFQEAQDFILQYVTANAESADILALQTLFTKVIDLRQHYEVGLSAKHYYELYPNEQGNRYNATRARAEALQALFTETKAGRRSAVGAR